MGATYQHDYKAFGKFVLNSKFMQKEMLARAKRVKAAAVADAQTYRDTGEYSKSFKVESGIDGGANHDRAYGRVKNTDPAALSIEFGHLSGHVGDVERRPVEGHHTLTKALDAAGDP